MFDKRGLGKRGQNEGLGLGTFLLIALGVVIVVVLIIGFTRGFDFIFGKFNVAPGQDLQAVASSCAIAAQQNLKVDFCSFKKVKVDGKNEYVNCQDPRLQLEASAAAIECPPAPNGKNQEVYQCEKLIQELKGTVGKKDCSKVEPVNGKKCITEIAVDSDVAAKHCSLATASPFD